MRTFRKSNSPQTYLPKTVPLVKAASVTYFSKHGIKMGQEIIIKT